MIRVVITNDQGDEIYTADFADFADAGAWIDGVMKADDSASHVFTENVARFDEVEDGNKAVPR